VRKQSIVSIFKFSYFCRFALVFHTHLILLPLNQDLPCLSSNVSISQIKLMARIAIIITFRSPLIPTLITDILFYKSFIAIITKTPIITFFLLTALTQDILTIVAPDLILFEGQLSTIITNLFFFTRASLITF
jgi:hypothetical protein